jgi:molybdenum cofactor cytidylyltransferase
MNRMLSLISIAPVILAAGDSTRMGYPKALLPLGKETFLSRILGIVQKTGFAVPTIILGKAAGIIQPHIESWPANVRINPEPDRGQLSSIQIGLSNLNPDIQAAMIWPVDQPAVSEELVANLARIFMESAALIAIPRCRDKRGHPAIFHHSIFREFMDAPLEEGPKSILLRHRQDTIELPTDESAVVQDIDTPAEYAALTGESLERALAQGK